MPRQRLYVIGNGFDLHHKINSSYYQFGEYLKRVDTDHHRTIEGYLPFDGNWSGLEETLAYMDVDLVIDEASDFLQSYGAEDWSDSYHHDFQYEVQRIVTALSGGLKSAFTKWVGELDIPSRLTCAVALLPLNVSAKYLNFNYTNTLQKLYQIPEANVLHIHNAISDEQPNLILGHAYGPMSRKSLNHGVDLEDQDVRITQANEILDSYFSETYKPTAEVIERHRGYFSSLTGVDEIYVVGHSLAEVDMPYFSEIVVATKSACPKWVVTYHNSSDIVDMQRALSSIGVANAQVSFVTTPNLPAYET